MKIQRFIIAILAVAFAPEAPAETPGVAETTPRSAARFQAAEPRLPARAKPT